MGLDIKKIDPEGIGEWTTNNSGQRVYYVPTTENRLAGRMYREDGSSHSSFWDPAGNCFVATSAFENQNHPSVEALRRFRDTVMAESVVGRLFIKAYYDGSLGHIGAKALDAVPAMKPAVRGTLDWVVDHYVNPALEKREAPKPYK